MKLFDDNMQAGQAGSFGFSGVRPDKLGAAEYTLVTYVGDKTGSVSRFANELLETKRAIVAACQKSARSEFLLFRNTEFNTQIVEVHGFAELSTIDTSLYQPPHCTGLTALYDATFAAVAVTNEYAKTLSDQDFSVNGIIFVVTDGDDTSSIQTFQSVANEISRGIQQEWLESLNVILVGINAQEFKLKLEEFVARAGLTQYVDVGDATPQRLAKLAAFVSSSISSQSQALGTGGASQPLTF
ncbi:MAG: hypothetical protein Q7S87_03375 [Agitococcus sp.]|nr:hypothetical protein [Agitococcus sp.]MDO9178678.1 hypothetical protein [Agitococcus sp.]